MTPIYSCQAELPASSDAAPMPTAFLDRDGVLNVDKGYVSRQEDFEWVEGAKEAVDWLRASGYRVVIVTNQSGIGRGYYSESDFLRLMESVLGEIEVDAVFYCACSPESGCPWRKPGTGMLEAADRIAAVDRARSFLVGDKESDLEAAVRFGVRAIEFRGGNLFRKLTAELA